MSCRASGAELCFDEVDAPTEGLLLSSRTLRDGLCRTDVSVYDIRRGGCVQKIATELGATGMIP